MEIEEIKSVPYTPQSHPYVERLIGTTRREYLDQLLFWNERDLENKLNHFKNYYNIERAHSSLNRVTPEKAADKSVDNVISIDPYCWKSHARELFQLPMAA